MSEIKREREFFHDKLYLPLTKLRDSPAFSLSPLKLLVCDGGIGRGVRFGQSCVHVDAISETNGAGLKYNRIYTFTELFTKGCGMLMDYITMKGNCCGSDLRVLETLLSFVRCIEEGSNGLNLEGRNSSQWPARLAVHLFSPLSLIKDCFLDNQCPTKFRGCPCSCNTVKSEIFYGDTSFGNTQTWYGRFDVIIGKTAAYEQNGLKKKRCESLVAATTVSEEYNDDSSDEDDYFQNEAKPDNLDGHLSELISQTIVFSFHQKKCNPSLSLVPSIGVSKSHIQFHFYDSAKDIYLVSQGMPLFYEDNKLQLSTVIATWMVMNYKHLLTGPTEKMVKDCKFGFHTNISSENLNLYKNNIEMGLKPFKPKLFKVSAVVQEEYELDKSATGKIEEKYQYR